MTWILFLLLVTVAAVSAQTLITIGGTGVLGYNGDNVLATTANLNYARSLGVDSFGNVIIADTDNHRVRKIDENGIITTIAGTGAAGFSGDNGLASMAQLNKPYGITVDNNDNILIADTYNQRIRRIDVNGTITTIAGSGPVGEQGNNGPATSARLSYPERISADKLGNFFITSGFANTVRKVDRNGVITLFAGTGTLGYNGDNIEAINAQLSTPASTTSDENGNVYIVDSGNHRLRKVDVNGTITTVAGTGFTGSSTDNIPATSTTLYYPSGVTIDLNGDILIADTINCRVRKIDSNTQIITTIAGTRLCSYNGDVIFPPTAANMRNPTSVAVDYKGDVIISDFLNFRIRKIVHEPVCFGVVSSSSSVCSGHGNCIAQDTCNCITGYDGNQCEIPVCNNTLATDPSVCSSHGTCISPNHCLCLAGNYTGTNCEYAICNNTSAENSTLVCSGFGICVAPNNCTCNQGYYGTVCEGTSCFGVSSTNSSVCSGHGTCSSWDNCSCFNGFTGNNCSMIVPPPGRSDQNPRDASMGVTLQSLQWLLFCIILIISL